MSKESDAFNIVDLNIEDLNEAMEMRDGYCRNCIRINEEIAALRRQLAQVNVNLEAFLKLVTQEMQAIEGSMSIGGAEIVRHSREKIRGHETLLANHEERLASLEWKRNLSQ